MYAESISNERITQLPKLTYPGQIVTVRAPAELGSALEGLARSPIVGFDTETKPTFRRGVVHGVTLLQLATRHTALLVRIKETGVPPALVRFLEDPRITKVGAAIHDDIKALQKYSPFTPQGFIDLQHVVRGYGIECLSVRKMAAIVLNVRVSKSQQLSNWDGARYTPEQEQYAAIDAWVCLEIYQKLMLSPTAP